MRGRGEVPANEPLIVGVKGRTYPLRLRNVGVNTVRRNVAFAQGGPSKRGEASSDFPLIGLDLLTGIGATTRAVFELPGCQVETHESNRTPAVVTIIASPLRGLTVPVRVVVPDIPAEITGTATYL